MLSQTRTSFKNLFRVLTGVWFLSLGQTTSTSWVLRSLVHYGPSQGRDGTTPRESPLHRSSPKWSLVPMTTYPRPSHDVPTTFDEPYHVQDKGRWTFLLTPSVQKGQEWSFRSLLTEVRSIIQVRNLRDLDRNLWDPFQNREESGKTDFRRSWKFDWLKISKGLSLLISFLKTFDFY